MTDRPDARMPYVILSANGDEFDRRALTAPAVVGRAPECELAVRDILLSRRHCQLEPAGDEHPGRWVVTDLGSKNGTYVRGRPITARHLLRDGEDVRVGRTTITFKAGGYVPAPAGASEKARAMDARRRATDPTEALAGTVEGFTLVEPGEVEREPGAPVPRPRPQDPAAYQSDDVFGLVTDLVASSWDSIMAENSRPLAKERPLPSPNATFAGPGPRAGARSPRRPPRVALSLQADAAAAAPSRDAVDVDLAEPPSPATRVDAAAEPVPTLHVPPPVAAVPAHDTSIDRRAPARPRRARWWHRDSALWRHLLVLVASVLLALVMVGAWVAVIVTVPPAR